MTRSVQFSVIQDGMKIDFTVVEKDVNDDEIMDLVWTATIDESYGLTGDLRAIMWDVNDGRETKWSALDDKVAPPVLGSDVTDWQFDANAVDNFGNGANLHGEITSRNRDFDAGVEIGTQGIATDDIQSTTWTVLGDTSIGSLSLDDIGNQRIGVRVTSVGEPGGNRDGSLKIEGRIPLAPDGKDDLFSEEEDTCIAGNVLADNGLGADTDGDGDPLTVTEVIVDGTAYALDTPIDTGNGILTVGANGDFTFVPATSWTGTQTFDYTVTDGNGGFDCPTVTINVNEVAGITVDLEDGLAIDTDALTLSAADGAIVEVTRGPDNTLTFDLNVFVPDLPEKADIVLAQDLSGSFNDDISTLKNGNFMQDLAFALTAGGIDDLALGITSYVDYPISPFGIPSDFIYNVDQDLTTDFAAADAALDTLSIRNGNDLPEAQLVSLQQVGLGNGLTFRAESQRFVVLTTDAAFHQAGNYAAGGPNDNDTDLSDGTGAGGLEDYPAIAQVAAALASNGLIPIFAVTAGQIGTYQALLDNLGVGGSVVQLAGNSSNLAAAILTGLSEVTTDVDLAITSDDYGFIQSVVPAGLGFDDVAGEATVTFELEIGTPADYADDEVTLTVPGFGEVTLDFSFGVETVDGSAGRDTLSGNNNANEIYGYERADVLDGEGGDDVLVGGTGNDTLTGGSGADVFVFEDADKFRGTDTVLDYVDGVDMLQLSGFGAVGFGDLVIANDTGGNATISVMDGKADEIIAVLNGVDASALDMGDFIFA
ncbi:Ig-like domain-containing protein [Sulfitobacter sp. HNIBRBA3233]|uniref:Ig-like domain-containing protein n=1 Tax=Sulfitobacter marinivivus TaxID=3158558 RepID=UPI0032DF3CFF